MIERWRPSDGVPVLSWATSLEDGARVQIENCARLPRVVRHVALMPDAHLGFGMPIGGVFGTKDVVVPNAVGVDIGCGVTLTRILGVVFKDLELGGVKVVMDQVRRDIPVGNGPGGSHRESLVDWEHESVQFSDAAAPIFAAAGAQLGTLGGGNHFVELQADEAGELYFMIHSGSRSVGKKINDHYDKLARGLNARWASSVPDKELAWLPASSDEGQAYLSDMRLAMAWAEDNRRFMSGAFMAGFRKALGDPSVEFDHVVDIHHNYADMERHFGEDLLVHRKGAVRARDQELVLVPGSMSTASYVCRGLGNEDSLTSSPHGAGRARSRSATRSMITKEDLQDSLGDVYLTTPGDVRDESSVAYKDIDAVIMAASDLVRPIKVLKPVGVLKG